MSDFKIGDKVYIPVAYWGYLKRFESFPDSAFPGPYTIESKSRVRMDLYTIKNNVNGGIWIIDAKHIRRDPLRGESWPSLQTSFPASMSPDGPPQADTVDSLQEKFWDYDHGNPNSLDLTWLEDAYEKLTGKRRPGFFVGVNHD